MKREGIATIRSETQLKVELRWPALSSSLSLVLARISWLPLVLARMDFDLAFSCGSLKNFQTSELERKASALVCVVTSY